MRTSSRPRPACATTYHMHVCIAYTQGEKQRQALPEGGAQQQQQGACACTPHACGPLQCKLPSRSRPALSQAGMWRTVYIHMYMVVLRADGHAQDACMQGRGGGGAQMQAGMGAAGHCKRAATPASPYGAQGGTCHGGHGGGTWRSACVHACVHGGRACLHACMHARTGDRRREEDGRQRVRRHVARAQQHVVLAAHQEGALAHAGLLQDGRQRLQATTRARSPGRQARA